MTGHRRKGSSRRADVSTADRRAVSSTRASARPGPQGSVLPGGTVPTSRQAVREQRKDQARKRWVVVATVVAVVLVLGLVAAWWLGRDEGPPPPSPVTVRTERTLTLSLAEPGEAATSGALLVADPNAASADAVLVPSRVFVDGPTPEGIPFGDTVLLGSVAAPGNALADTLDVVVDGTWQLSSPALSGLVDGVGGVLVDVDSQVLTPGADNGPQRVLLAAGDQQLLTGPQAVGFAQYLAPGEPEEARLARLGQVLDQLTRRLPASQPELTALLAQTAADAQITGIPDQLAAFLVAFGDVAREGEAGFQVLPTNPLETGGPNPALITDPAGAEQLRRTVLSGSVPTGAAGTDIEVLVQNGVGTPGLEQEAADLLRADGYQFLNGGNAASFDNKQTDVLIPDATPASVELGYAVAELLGVPRSAVRTTDQGSSVADVIVVLGADFKP